MDKKVKNVIEAAILTDNLRDIAKQVTVTDLLDYMSEEINKDIIHTHVKGIKCPICGVMKNKNKVTMSHRYVRYLAMASRLSMKDIKDGGDGYIHHDVVRSNLKMMSGIDLTSYSYITRYPWDFLEPRMTTDEKIKRDGCFKITERGKKFIRGMIEVPETIYVYDKQVVHYSEELVNCKTVPKINFHEMVEDFKSW